MAGLKEREGEVDEKWDDLDEGLCMGGGNVIAVFLCIAKAEPRLGWYNEDGVWPEHGVVRQSHCLEEEH